MFMTPDPHSGRMRPVPTLFRNMDRTTVPVLTRLSGWLFLFTVALVVAVAVPRSSWAQQQPADTPSLVERYRSDRIRMLVRQFLQDGPVRALPLRSLSTPLDSLYPSQGETKKQRTATTETSSFPIDEVRPVSDLERGWFQEKYERTNWSFLGPGLRLTFLDTTLTRDLRARLQARFGDPTRTAAEMDFEAWRDTPLRSRQAPSQFEYWFVVNESIPVKVTDVNGPRERGLIVSTERTYRNRLHALRRSLLGPLRTVERAPYVDYYFADEQGRWYRAGFDGQSFFLEPVARFDIVPGKRPRLDTVRSAVDTPAQ